MRDMFNYSTLIAPLMSVRRGTLGGVVASIQPPGIAQLIGNDKMNS